MTATDRDNPAVQWLRNSKDPSIRYFTLKEILDQPADDSVVKAAQKLIPRGPRFRLLMAGQLTAVRPPSKRGFGKSRDVKFSAQSGGFGVHPYQKWTGAHWRLVSLVELDVPAGHKGAIAAARQVLRWLWGNSHRGSIKKINGLTRRCASQEGNALAVCSRLGLAADPQVKGLAESLVEWQWPDGGWNCDKRQEAHHSSFYESLAPLWGLIEYHRATGESESLHAAERASELFLKHRLFRFERTREVINPEWLRFHYPLYWHYDILQALRTMMSLGKLKDERAREALDIVERKRGPDGRWRVEGCYWKLFSKGASLRPSSGLDLVDWGRRGPNEMTTLNALRVLKAAGRP